MLLKHYEGTEIPSGSDIEIGEIVVQLNGNTATLYTKTFEGVIVEIGQGALNLTDLQDIDFTNATDGAFIIQQGNSFVITDKVGTIDSLTDVEINNPQAGDYLRYDPTYLAYRNFQPSYSLYQLLDVNVIPSNSSNSSSQNNEILYFDYPSNSFKTRPRTNLLQDLLDVNVSGSDNNQVLVYNATDDKWENQNLQIVNDTNPTLGGNLNASAYTINNSSYRTQYITANVSSITCDYSTGDYFVIQGVDVNTNSQCLINITANNLAENTSVIMMLEIRQSTGNIFIAGLTNAKFEDGKPIQLSGNGKIDLITITIQNINNIITSYVTANALNLASLGEGGIPAYRYDESRYATIEQFDIPHLYDNYFKYVQLLLNFETTSLNNIWYADKSLLANNITTNTTQLATSFYSFGLQEYVAEFLSYANSINITSNSNITINNDFTFEFFINYPSDNDYNSNTTITNTFIDNNASNNNSITTFRIIYTGAINTTQNTILQVIIGSNTYTLINAFSYFSNEDSNYIHIAVVRSGVYIYIYIQGIYQVCKESNSSGIVTDSSITSFNITNADINLVGNLNSVRLTKYARYKTNFLLPNMRFGLVGGYENIDSNGNDYSYLQDIVFDLYSNVGNIYNPVANEMFL